MSDPVASRIRKFAEIAQELREGKKFQITRLTRLKALCKDPQATAEFALYIARLTWDKMKDAERPINLEPEEWAGHKELVAEALSEMESYMEYIPKTSASPGTTGRPLWRSIDCG